MLIPSQSLSHVNLFVSIKHITWWCKEYIFDCKEKKFVKGKCLDINTEYDIFKIAFLRLIVKMIFFSTQMYCLFLNKENRYTGKFLRTLYTQSLLLERGSDRQVFEFL